MNTWMDLLTDILLLAGAAFLLISLFTGLAFVLVPRKAVGVERQADKRISLRQALKPLEIPRSTERFFYRHHRIVGALISVFSVLFLWIYLIEGEGGRIAEWMAKQFNAEIVGAWTANLGWFMVLLNFGALVIGIVMLVRPSALKRLEEKANSWISTRRGLRPLESERDPLGRFATRHPRVFGSLVLAGSLYIGVNMVVLLG